MTYLIEVYSIKYIAYQNHRKNAIVNSFAITIIYAGYIVSSVKVHTWKRQKQSETGFRGWINPNKRERNQMHFSSQARKVVETGSKQPDQWGNCGCLINEIKFDCRYCLNILTSFLYIQKQLKMTFQDQITCCQETHYTPNCGVWVATLLCIKLAKSSWARGYFSNLYIV